MSLPKTKPRLYHETLGITPQQVSALPKITPHLERVMEGLAERDLPHEIYYYLEASGDPAVRKVMFIRETYNAQQRRFVPLEAFCAAAEVDPLAVLTAAIQAIDRLTSYTEAVRMAAGKKDVVSTLIQGASMLTGTEDRALFMKATGLLPQPKGAQTLIQVTQNSSHSSAPAAVFLEPPEKTIRKLSDRLSRMLPAPVAEDADLLQEED